MILFPAMVMGILLFVPVSVLARADQTVGPTAGDDGVNSGQICGDNSNCGAGDAASGQKTSERLTELGNHCANTTKKSCLQNNPIVKYLNIIVDVLSAGVGIVVIGLIILGGIQYSLAGDNSSAITAAKQRMINGLIALLLYAFIFSFLQWIVPGGVFNS